MVQTSLVSETQKQWCSRSGLPSAVRVCARRRRRPRRRYKSKVDWPGPGAMKATLLPFGDRLI